MRETSATDRQMAGAMRSLLKQTAAAISKPKITARTVDEPEPEPAAPAGAAPSCWGTNPRGDPGGTLLAGACEGVDLDTAAEEAGAVAAASDVVSSTGAPDGSAPGDGRVAAGAKVQPATSRAGRVGAPPSAGSDAGVWECEVLSVTGAATGVSPAGVTYVGGGGEDCVVGAGSTAAGGVLLWPDSTDPVGGVVVDPAGGVTAGTGAGGGGVVESAGGVVVEPGGVGVVIVGVGVVIVGVGAGVESPVDAGGGSTVGVGGGSTVGVVVVVGVGVAESTVEPVDSTVGVTDDVVESTVELVPVSTVGVVEPSGATGSVVASNVEVGAVASPVGGGMVDVSGAVTASVAPSTVASALGTGAVAPSRTSADAEGTTDASQTRASTTKATANRREAFRSSWWRLLSILLPVVLGKCGTFCPDIRA